MISPASRAVFQCWSDRNRITQTVGIVDAINHGVPTEEQRMDVVALFSAQSIPSARVPAQNKPRRVLMDCEIDNPVRRRRANHDLHREVHIEALTAAWWQQVAAL